MNGRTILGALLLVVGVLILAYQGFTYTSRDKVVDAGPVEITAERTKNVSLPPIAGVICLVGGILVLAVGRGRRAA